LGCDEDRREILNWPVLGSGSRFCYDARYHCDQSTATAPVEGLTVAFAPLHPGDLLRLDFTYAGERIHAAGGSTYVVRAGWLVVDEDSTPDDDRRLAFALFIEPAAITLRRALVARNGVEDGSDAEAEAVAWAWEHRAEVESMANPLGYLFRVGQSSLRRERRIRGRAGEFRVDDYVVDTLDFDADLFAALRRLTPNHRTAVVMVHMYGFPYSEVADVMDVSEAAITNHIHRGLRRLRQLLQIEVPE